MNFSGGRKITAVGTGFDLVQRAVMRVLPSADEFSFHPSNAEVIYISKKVQRKPLSILTNQSYSLPIFLIKSHIFSPFFVPHLSVCAGV